MRSDEGLEVSHSGGRDGHLGDLPTVDDLAPETLVGSKEWERVVGQKLFVGDATRQCSEDDSVNKSRFHRHGSPPLGISHAVGSHGGLVVDVSIVRCCRISPAIELVVDGGSIVTRGAECRRWRWSRRPDPAAGGSEARLAPRMDRLMLHGVSSACVLHYDMWLAAPSSRPGPRESRGGHIKVRSTGPDSRRWEVAWGQWTRCWAALLLTVAAPGINVFALDPQQRITQYVRESWTTKDGAPAGTINDISQTPNGYLWLGTEGEGLVRFDGIAFARVDELDAVFGQRVNRITSLICGRDGALWVGTGFGLARLRDGRWTTFDRGEAKDVLGLHEAADGTVWYARHWEGVFRVSGETVMPIPLPGKPRFIGSDSQGNVWAGGYEGLWRFVGDERQRFGLADGLVDQNITRIHGDENGNLWLGSQVGLTLVRNDKVVGHFTARDGLSSDDVSAIYVDRSGGVWIGTVVGGLNRKTDTGFEALGKAFGLTNNHVTALFEDREGSLWIGTSNGLNRLRDARVVPIGDSEGLSSREPMAIVEGKHGTVFVSSGFGGLDRIENGQVQFPRPNAVPGSRFDGPLYADSDGAIWSGHNGGLSYRQDGRTQRFPVEGQVSCVSHDGSSLVFAVSNGQVFRLVRGRPERFRLADGSLLGPETLGFDFVWAMHFSRSGVLWLATTRGAIAVQEGRARPVWQRGKLSVRSIFEDEEGTIWLGTMAGLVRVAGESVAVISAAHGLPQDDVYQVVADRRGGLWMSSVRGIAHVAKRQVEEVVAGRRQTVDVELLGAADGMRTSEATYWGACATKDGRVWFTTIEAVVVIDPDVVRRNKLVPPVVLERILADGVQLALGSEVRVPAGTERLVIEYGALSLLVPQRVRVKFRLEGYDDDWVDGGGRRAASYTKLPPGRYRFHVIAANNDGVWNEVGASVSVRQIPYFYQTVWFLLAMCLAGVGLVAGVLHLRSRHQRRREQELQRRVAESLAHIKTLRGLLPICAWCKKVRDDSGYWSQIEEYVRQNTEAKFSHGICPQCREEKFPKQTEGRRTGGE